MNITQFNISLHFVWLCNQWNDRNQLSIKRDSTHAIKSCRSIDLSHRFKTLFIWKFVVYDIFFLLKTRQSNAHFFFVYFNTMFFRTSRFKIIQSRDLDENSNEFFQILEKYYETIKKVSRRLKIYQIDTQNDIDRMTKLWKK